MTVRNPLVRINGKIVDLPAADSIGGAQPGSAATITVGSTTTGAPGSSASVTNSGSSSAAVLDFTIPQGATGATGNTGATGAQGPAGGPASTAQGRLTLASGSPVPTADQTSKTTVYWSPWKGNQLGLYSGSAWSLYSVPEIAIGLGTLTSAKGYDVFAFSSTATPSSTNTTTDIVTFGSATGWATGSMVTIASSVGGLVAGTQYFYNAASSTTGSFHTTLANALAGSSKVDLTANITNALAAVSLELSAAWSSDTARTDALTTQDGIKVKSGALTRRYLGSFYTTSTTTTEDSAQSRYLYNEYNQVRRHLLRRETATTWTYSTATIRQANNNTSNQVNVFLGSDEVTLAVSLRSVVGATAIGTHWAGIGLDSVTAFTGIATYSTVSGTGHTEVLNGEYAGQPGLGKHYFSWLECPQASGTVTWRGTETAAANGANAACGLVGNLVI